VRRLGTEGGGISGSENADKAYSRTLDEPRERTQRLETRATVRDWDRQAGSAASEIGRSQTMQDGGTEQALTPGWEEGRGSTARGARPRAREGGR
jgi:hypothetical protein